ncbi:MAG: redox-regulated ATPase YchF [Rhodospirillaceae bacterium]|jgi:ribosome-binding ATPase|nr:redox-regulated ATPase YchF [Rhodospirillaceae bacterium]MBT6204681.1 redox-regulated ATPase YchF [Rhodospirillaceae bacterium]MBT7613259.1 redox-regulated ATPase YchF [Rhodospirillaceae bacterium]
MGIRCGIVGLPNVGKSTLFNALTATSAAQVGNFPFCTVDPNIGRVNVPDPRLDAISSIVSPAKVVWNNIEFVDIAGLVRGASKGEGLGNQFLGNIREVDAVLHLVRCFEGGDISHVDGTIDPLRDIETIDTELMLADMESLEKRVDAAAKKATGGDREAKADLPIMERALAALQEGRPARSIDVSDDEAKRFNMLQLLTSKPVLYVCNVDEDDAAEGNALTERVAQHAAAEGAQAVVVSARIEAELAEIEEVDEKQVFLEDLGLTEAGLNRVIRAAYRLLGLITFFTAGPKEARAWTVTEGSTAPNAAGEIHTDFERGFICAETIGFDDYVDHKGEQGAKQAGRMRQEGREYRVKDGDVFLFRFNV